MDAGLEEPAATCVDSITYTSIAFLAISRSGMKLDDSINFTNFTRKKRKLKAIKTNKKVKLLGKAVKTFDFSLTRI